jgi:hypothetical protein
MTHRLWNKTVLALSILCVMGVFLVNVVIDPANIFNHSHSLNRWKYGFDERLQKTSYLTHRSDIDAIDTILFGSSRNTYYDQENFEGLTVFNYAVSNGNPEEYVTFLDYARSLKGTEFENIIIGLDFVGYGFDDKNAKSNALLMDDIKGSFFWLKYVSFHMLVNSMKTVVSSTHTKLGTRVYDNNNNTYISRVEPDTTIATAKRRSGSYYSNMVFDDGYFDALRDIRAANPNTNFIVFTNPVSTPFLDAIYTDTALKERYFQWTREIVDVFGDVYFFTYPNEFSQNYMTTSKDGDHYYKETLKTISRIIQDKTNIAPYGLRLISERMDIQMDDLRTRVQNIVR